MRKLFYLFLLFIFLGGSGKAQTVSNVPANMKSDTLGKSILDNATYRVYYSMSYSKDSTLLDAKTECQTVLLIGARYNEFIDLYRLKRDSVFDALVKSKEPPTNIINKSLAVLRKAKFDPVIIKNYPDKSVCTIQQMVGLHDKYRYTDEIKIKWTLGSQEKEIKGYTCKSATCSYRGRDYLAWYAPEIPVSEGPYVFSGLPGLILEIADTRNHYLFTVNGLEKEKKYDPIYLLTSKLVNSTREQTRKAIRNDNDSPAAALKSSGKIKLDDKTLAKIKVRPYNPIELE